MVKIRVSINPLLLLVAFCIYYTPFFANAQYYTGPISAAVGGAGRASVEVAETMMLNPASLAHAPSASASFFYSDGITAQDTGETLYGLSLVDNSEDVLIPGGIAYLERRRVFPNYSNVKDRYVNASIGQFSVGQVAWGLSLLYLKSQEDAGGSHTQLNGVAGLHYNPIPSLGVGLVYYNIVEAEEDVPDHLKLLPKLGVGATFVFSEFVRARFDFAQIHKFNPDRKWEYGGGLEAIFKNFNIFRFGYKTDELMNYNYLTLGYSFLGPRFHINYSYVKNQSSGDGALHGVDIMLPF